MKSVRIRVVVVNMDHHHQYDVRIDRRSPFGNGFVLEKHGRREGILKFEQFLDAHPAYRERLLDRLEEQVRAAAEKIPGDCGEKIVRLGCHCRPLHCHGDVWIRLLQERLT